MNILGLCGVLIQRSREWFSQGTYLFGSGKSGDFIMREDLDWRSRQAPGKSMI